MKLSARNRLVGTVESVEKGIITPKVKIRIEKPALVTAVVTKVAIDDLDLKPGDKVEAIVKSTSVMIAKE
jgi:molybdate transport system regulatory protein